jgi:hypothetical protein
MLHELKTWPSVFQHMVDGVKTFEYRKDDRHYAVGDTLRLREWSPSICEYSGREVAVEVVYKVDGGQFGIPAGYCVMSVRLSCTGVQQTQSAIPACDHQWTPIENKHVIGWEICIKCRMCRPVQQA